MEVSWVPEFRHAMSPLASKFPRASSSVPLLNNLRSFYFTMCWTNFHSRSMLRVDKNARKSVSLRWYVEILYFVHSSRCKLSMCSFDWMKNPACASFPQILLALAAHQLPPSILLSAKSYGRKDVMLCSIIATRLCKQGWL